MVIPEVKSESATLLEQAMSAMQAGDKEGAKSLLHRLVEIEPGREAAWLWLASLYNELPAIAHCLQQAVHINPQNAQATQALHAVLQRMQAPPANGQTAPPNSSPNAGSSPPLFDENGRPFDFEELKRRGIVAGKGGRRDEARQYLLAACEANDSDAETWFWLSTVVDDPEDRQIALENVLTLDPLHEAAQTAYDENSRLLADRQAAPQPGAPASPASPASPAASEGQAPPVAPAPATTLLEPAALETMALEPATVRPPFDLPVQAEAELSLPPLPPPDFAPDVAPNANPAPAFEPLPIIEEAEAHDDSPSGPRLGGSSKLFLQPSKSEGESEAEPEARDEEETVIAGKYRIINRTEGTWGPNYIVCDVKNKRFFTLQAQRAEMLDSKKGSVNTLTHKGQKYTILPMSTDGLTLRNLVSTIGKMPADLVAQYGLDLLKALAAEHAKGPILTARKVIAPDSVSFNNMGEILLDAPNSSLLVSASNSQVKPFLPTEQANNGTLAPTSDIFAIGALLFFMLTGAPPPPAERVPRKQGETFFPGHFIDFPDLPEDLARAIATALQPNPGDRYATAGEMASALRSTAAGRHAKREIPTRLVAIAAGAVAVALVGWVVMSGMLNNIKVPFIDTLTGAAQAAAAPTLTPVPPTPVPPAPLGRVVVSTVDSRLFPVNSLYFSALDTNGLPMFGFQPGMVKLRENGSEVVGIRLTELRKTTDAISVIVAMDTGDAMGGHVMDDAKTAVHILADRLQPGDQMSFLSFGGATQTNLEYTVSKTAFLAAVNSQLAGGRPAWGVADVVNFAAERVSTQPQGGYTALVIISNGGLPKDVSGLVRAANSVNLPVYFVGMNRATYPEQAANELAAGTGGVALVAETPDTGGAGEAAKKLEKMLHNVYKLVYDTPAPSTDVPHEVELTLAVGSMSQSDKRGYVVRNK
jgi:tetratricopeptide (TPR) repeat protein